jgi:hypothetical protein
MTARPAGPASPGGTAVAPPAPGRLGEAVPIAALSGYLTELADWVDARRRELDRVDAAALRSTEPDSYSGDVLLSMALWQSVHDRHATLLRLWDSGRADATAREKMGQVIWARMAPAGGAGGAGGSAGGLAGAGGLALSLVEACRLSDALLVQLTTRMSFDPSAADAAARVAAVREALERLRELVKQEPSWRAQVENLALRTNDLATRAMRGADVSSPLQQLESDAAQAERDLIVRTASVRPAERDAVAAARRLVDDRAEAQARWDALDAREDAVHALVARCEAQIVNAPRFAVPEPDVLGPVPQGRAELDAYLTRLDAVERAMAFVEHAYSAPLARRVELVGLLDAFRVMAQRTGQDDDPVVRAALEQVRATLAAVPCDVEAAGRYAERLPLLIRSAAGSTGPENRQERS